MLVVIILLAAVVVGELARQLMSSGAPSGGPSNSGTPKVEAPAVPVAAGAATTPGEVALPAGSRIVSITATGDRAVILITHPDGGQEVRSVDPRTGAAATLLTTTP